MKGTWATEALRGVRDEVYWLDDPRAPDPRPPLSRQARADCVIIGAGFSGLWSALKLAERRPEWSIIVVDGGRVGWGASGRNGGFCDASLTHGLANGLSRFGEEMELLEKLGGENLAGIASTVATENIDCDYWPVGTLDVATSPWQLEGIEEDAEVARRFGHDVRVLDQEGVRAEVSSPTYLGGVVTTNRCAMVNPARLAWGLAGACERRGVSIYEGTHVTALSDHGSFVEVATAGSVTLRAPHVILATNAFPPLLPGLQSYVLPVYDYVLMTEPLSEAQLESVGWQHRYGLSDLGNLFHYYRLSADNRILWGGYDAVYHWRNGMGPRYRLNERTHEMLSNHFFETFPQLEGVRFSHAWGGAIDTCSRFSMFFGHRYGGKVRYVLGFTGLGVGATRFGASVLVEQTVGETSDATELTMVTKKPIPFPPEPLRSAVVGLTRKSLMAADRNEGQRNLWLKVLDRIGVGFDS